LGKENDKEHRFDPFCMNKQIKNIIKGTKNRTLIFLMKKYLEEKYTKRTLNLDTKTEEALEYLNGQKEIEERGIGIKKLKNETS
jgi:hypothetical protein